MADLTIQLQISRTTPEPIDDPTFEAFRQAVQSRVEAEWPAAEVTVTSGPTMQASVLVDAGGHDDVAIADALPGVIDAAWADWYEA